VDHNHDGEVDRFGQCITCAAGGTPAGGDGRAAAEEALEAVYHGADPDWLRKAQAVVRHLADVGTPFTTDDVWKRVPPAPEPRAIGAVVRWAAQAGLIVNTRTTRPSHRAECHGRPVTVWGPAAGRML
jgi:hypothetical protein